jgi:hypothetical protein
MDLTLVAPHEVTATGVVVWFEAQLDDGVFVHNAPGSTNHWNQVVFGLSTPRPLQAGEPLAVTFELDEGALEMRA